MGNKKAFKITVLGDGGWGTALAIVNARDGNDVVLWSAFPEHAKLLSSDRENKKFLPNAPFPEKIRISSDLQEAITHGDIIILAIPTQFLRNILYKVKEMGIPKEKILVSVSKGIEKKTGSRPSEIIGSILADADNPLVVLSGPSHAEETAHAMPTLVVVASKSEKAAEAVREAMSDTYFRIYTQTDVVGVELGGALKNVIAIAAGVCDGLKFGDNSKSGLVTRGLLEMMRFGIKLGANPNTFFGLSGLGDLITTCFSPHGRNLMVGRQLGEGKKIQTILQGMEMVAEGVATAESVHELSQKLGINLPIMDEVYNMVFSGKDAKHAVLDLLNRDAREEWKQY